MFTSTFSPSPRQLIKAGFVVCSLMGLSPAYALTQCVDNSGLLLTTLFLGQSQTEPLTIKLVKGTYLMTTNLNFLMAQRTSIQGGYNADCTVQSVDAANTVIDMGQKIFGLSLQDDDSTSYLRVEALTVRNAMAFSLDIGAFRPLVENDKGQTIVRNVRLTQIGGPASQLTPVRMGAFGGPMTMENVVLDHLETATDCAVYFGGSDGAGALVNHLTADLWSGDHFCIKNDSNPANHSVYNSILSSSNGGQPHFRSDVYQFSSPESSFTFANTMMLNPQVIGAVSTQAILFESPRWIDPAAGNYRLSTNPLSAGINSGTFVPPGGEPPTDIAGNPRIQGSFPDRGAYEASGSNATTLTVTNTQDSGGGSLRQAILDANTSPLLAKQIKFDIRGALNVPICPAVIALNTALPAIASPMSIDGYSQPVSTKNTDVDAFNANLCVSIKAASSLPVGFKVLANAPADVQLSLRGVAIGGFAQPVVLLGGSNHVIAGNQFGGTALGVNLPGAGFNAISIGVNAGGSLIVGGNNAVDRNVIVDANFAGINIQSDVVSSIDRCQIVNNLIGLKPDGNSALANSTGISVNGEGCYIVRNRIAGNSSVQVLINGNKNVLQQNQIGITVNGQGIPNLATGVLIRGSGNIVGAFTNSASTLTANTIRFNTKGGVAIQGDSAANGNSVNANLIYDNVTDGQALDIDLQPSGGTPVVTTEGATANDVGDLDIGPNFLQNYPVAKGLIYTGTNTTNRPATLSGMLDALPGAQRVDVYFSSSINAVSLRGHAQQHLGHATVVVDANGRKFFTLPIAVPNQNPGGVISMTSTDGAGNTSEVGNGLATDTLFADGVD